MALTRRTLLAAASVAVLAPRAAHAATVTDDAARSVNVPDKVHRVFPAGLEAAILLYTLAPDMLLGWPQANTPEQCSFMLPNICHRPELGHLADGGSSPTVGSVTARKPDLILDVGSTSENYAAQADRIQKQTGISYALLDGRVLSLSTSYEKLGRLTGRAIDGADFADYCNQTLAVITNRIAFVPPEKRPRVYYARGARGLTTALAGASQMESIELVARNVAGGSAGKLADVTTEQVRQWDPDIILATEPGFAAVAREDSAWASVKAVREARVYLMPRVPFGWVDAPASANRLIGLWWLVKTFYPEIFKDDLRELTRDFFKKFYHVVPSDVQIERVLAGKD